MLFCFPNFKTNTRYFCRRNTSFVILLIGFSILQSCNPANGQSSLDFIKLPAGFTIDIYAAGIENARSMTLGDEGTLFVGSRFAGNVYALVDTDQDQKADTLFVLASGLRMPNGVAFHNGDLYVAEISRIIKFEQVESSLSNPPQPIVVYDKLPQEGHHGWKYLAIGPDKKLYTQIGAPCNNCLSKDSVFASIARMNLDGSGFEIYAKGVRNTVGFTWHPTTSDLWFTDNGRDWMGDNSPPDELNMADKKGLHFGYPFCHGGHISDPEFGDKFPCNKFQAPVQKLGAHVAPLGLKFYTGKQFPEAYKQRIFIAEHGSWNRTIPSGYRVTMVEIDEKGKALKYEPFAEGWLQGFRKKGRPVDILQMPDGSLLVSDDYADMIYRISYQ